MLETVSVVITCHNLESYIGFAIDSVINQDYCGPVEVLVVDDFSTDRSPEIINSYGKVRYLRSDQNLGVLMATIHGLENTTGQLVFFLDGDDVWEPAKLSQVVERFRADENLALVTHDLKYIDSRGQFLDLESRPEQVMFAVPASQENAMIRNGILQHSDYVWLGSAYAVRRTLGNLKDFCAFSKALPDPFNTYQDWPLAFWVACQPQVRCGYVPRKLFQYRLHSANHSGDATNLAKAMRNFGRSSNTLYAISEIAARFEVDSNVIKATQRKFRFYTYLVDLYSGEKLQATKGFLSSLPYLITGTSSFWKEVMRFIGIQILGARRFIAWAAARR